MSGFLDFDIELQENHPKMTFYKVVDDVEISMYLTPMQPNNTSYSHNPDGIIIVATLFIVEKNRTDGNYQDLQFVIIDKEGSRWIYQGLFILWDSLSNDIKNESWIRQGERYQDAALLDAAMEAGLILPLMG